MLALKLLVVIQQHMQVLIKLPVPLVDFSNPGHVLFALVDEFNALRLENG